MRRWLSLWTGAAAALASTIAPATAAWPHPSPDPRQPLSGVRVLIVNDDSMQAAKPDGADGQGIYEMRRALCSAGAEVAVVAPWSAQSGAGTGSSREGTIFAVQHRTTLPAGYHDDCGGPLNAPVFGVCVSDTVCLPSSPSATPSDAVRIGALSLVQSELGWESGPDLVVSGVNAGVNIANFVNGSGTVGATIAALDLGIPAVAVSASFDDGTFAVSPETFTAAATASVDIIGDLWKRRLLTSRFGININHPAARDLTSSKPVYAQVGTGSFLAFDVIDGPAPGTLRFTGALCEPGNDRCLPETQSRPDTRWLLDKGRITVTPIAPNRSYTGPGATRLAVALATGL